MHTDFELCLSLQEGRHDISHFHGPTRSDKFSDHPILTSKSVTSAGRFIFIQWAFVRPLNEDKEVLSIVAYKKMHYKNTSRHKIGRDDVLYYVVKKDILS
ncbi:hypothetical protein [Solibacillus sp. FSL H8-0538]|uniref:hypothetical protein n=1 Tax=Solibacillus sp. FSL H8-0538 TaxID=2921400 RepID=UPI0030FA0CA8